MSDIMDQPVITQADINWIRDGIHLHLTEMVKQMEAYMHGEQPEDQSTLSRNKVRYEAHAIEYLLHDVKRCMQYGTPIPKVIVDERD